MQREQDRRTNGKNPFLTVYGTPHETVPFDRIAIADIEEAVREGMRLEDEKIKRIAESPERPTFENTVRAMERSGAVLERATTVMYNLLSAETCDELDELANRLAPELAGHRSDIMLNEALFRRVRQVRDEAVDLEGEDRRLLESTCEAFERSGAALDGQAKSRFREIDARLSQLALSFSQNVLKETNDFVLHVTDRDELAGLPESQVEQAAQAAAEKGLEGWAVTLKASLYGPFMMYASRRDLRRKLYMAYHTRCTRPGGSCNFDLVREIVNLRREKAQLLGYACYADYVLKYRMAGSKEKVYGLLDQLAGHYMNRARAEVEAVREQARMEQGPEFELEPWDFAYYARKLKCALYDVDAEMLRPYFELSRVREGVFGLANRLYGLTFRPSAEIQTYHPEVSAYEVLDADGSFLAVLYTDFHPREGKQGGAWMTNYKEQWREPDGTDSRPHVSVTMNFTRPTATRPALLTLEEVETFLHEFGHALHGILSRCRYGSLSGTNVRWDFVELPSQFMENYAVEKDFLRTFAFHYQTGEPIPEELVDRLVAARNFNVAYACMRQVSFGLLDMAFHTLERPFDGDVRAFEASAWRSAQVLPPPPEACMTAQFGHIMSGGYAAGYYGYKWAEVLDADAFSLFKEQGIFSREAARRFRDEVLSRGATDHPMTLYVRFRGKEPGIDALLRRNGMAPAGR